MLTHQDLLDLSRHLKQERLFVASEREQLQTLNTEVQATVERVYHASWVCCQQRQNLQQLILADKDATPLVCCRRANTLEHLQFTDGYKTLSYHEGKIGDMLKQLRENPQLVATLLDTAEKINQDLMQGLARISVLSLYGNAVMQEDETLLLQLIRCLMEMQVTINDNPRRLLRKGTCAFSVVFKLVNESLFSAKLFLTSALHKPVMQLLMEDEWFYDIDPQRALYRFPAQDRVARFGAPNSEDYEKKVKSYREFVTTKLYKLTERFISSIRKSMYCFPPSLSWIVTHLYRMVMKAGHVDETEARKLCLDLVFASFICPAICDPEPHGITSDAPIGYIARHNLMQVAQILQVLAYQNLEDIDARYRDLYGKFSKDCVTSVLDTILDRPVTEQPSASAGQTQNLTRASVLITHTDLSKLMEFLNNTSSSLEDNSEVKKQLQQLLSCVPSLSALQTLRPSPSPDTTPQPTPPGTPGTAKKHKVKDKKKPVLLLPEFVRSHSDDPELAQAEVSSAEDVLVVSLGVVNDCPGMMAEQKVIEQETKPKRVLVNSLVPGEDEPIVETGLPLQEKRTRFSLSHDEGSIATSDNLEAISEAASSHSVGSDLENENDNLSDMLSANVSGRGTPNISGRDTPTSQVSESAEEEEPEVLEPRPAAPDLPVTVRKSNREDVTEKFGKFEIKADLENYKDETKSTVSDTWSTDVLASDSEPPEQNQLERLEEVAEEITRQNLLGLGEGADPSETASDAWSTDVLASDTSERQVDRLLELEQDEAGSVSGRSQGQDEPDQADVSSQSGAEPNPGESPNQAVDNLMAMGAVGGASSNLDDVFVTTTASGRHSDPIISQRDGISSSPSILRHSEGTSNANRSVASLIDNFSTMDQKAYSAQQRESASFVHMQGKVGKALEAFDPMQMHELSTLHESVMPQSTEPLTDEQFSDGYDSENSPRNGTDIESSSGNPGMSAFAEEAMPPSSSGYVNNVGLQSAPSAEQRNSAKDDLLQLSNEIQSWSIRNNASSVCTSENGAPGNSSSEQRNDMDFFELLGGKTDNISASVSNQSENQSEEKTGTLSDSHTQQNFDEQGARPKVYGAAHMSAPPRISVSHQDSLPSCDTNGHAGVAFTNSSFLHSGNSSRGGQSVQTQLVDFSEVDKDSRSTHLSGNIPIPCIPVVTKTEDLSGGSADSADYAPKSRSSTESSTSSLVENKSHLENTPHKPDDREPEDKSSESKKKGGIFKSFRAGIFKGKGRKSGRHNEESKDDQSKLVSVEVTGDSSQESMEDILAKYRKHSTPQKTGAGEPSNAGGEAETPEKQQDTTDGPPAYDAANLESCKAFLDAKKKLRLVMSTADFHVLPWMSGQPAYPPPTNDKKDNDLVLFLQLQLAEAINLQDRDLIAQLRETIRCLRQFDNDGVRKLLKAMKEEYRGRSPYISYLVRCRQGLLATQAHLERLLNRIQRDKLVCTKYFVSVVVRLFLEKREHTMTQFITHFKKLTVSDEKTDLVERFLECLWQQMEQDAVWQAASEIQIDDAHVFVERYVMSHIYTNAMYPNGDGDLHRDQLFHEHIQQLSQEISPGHKDLMIPKVYHYECPWPAAQAEIIMINAYKTPRDKLACVLRCSSTIMNLLSMANEKSVPAADDFMPVLIFVLVKSNPPNLLSTVQYINSFYGSRLQGEEQYWWMQFCSGVEFIKTMIYNR